MANIDTETNDSVLGSSHRSHLTGGQLSAHPSSDFRLSAAVVSYDTGQSSRQPRLSKMFSQDYFTTARCIRRKRTIHSVSRGTMLTKSDLDLLQHMAIIGREE